MGGLFGSKKKSTPAPAPVVVDKSPLAGDAVRRKRKSEDRTSIQSTVGGDTGAATKTLLGS